MTTPTEQLTESDVSLNERRRDLLARFRAVRAFSRRIAEPLAAEDCVIQSMPDVSPTRWHLAHTTWFFETFLLSDTPGYRPFSEAFAHLFNSYYNTVGEPFPRARRGLLSRPTVAEVMQYRDQVDAAVATLAATDEVSQRLLDIVELGLHHEQQHQELMLTDIKHVLSCNPMHPQYEPAEPLDDGAASTPAWVEFDEGLREIGHHGPAFAYDNESPRHRVFLEAFALRSHPVTSGEYLEFIEDGGYERAELWLSLGWGAVREENWRAPLYWFQQAGDWWEFTLAGPRKVNHRAPVCHVSYFEADAFARWAGVRLPTEAEWEVASESTPVEGLFADDLMLRGSAVHPTNRAGSNPSLAQMFGDVWEWTASPYVAYPGYRPPDGALGEYNGKFMCNQFVLRGGSCATPAGHVRRTYRNFFPPEARWQFSGLRLAR